MFSPHDKLMIRADAIQNDVSCSTPANVQGYLTAVGFMYLLYLMN